jgi:uncharacterized membrane protein YkgB
MDGIILKEFDHSKFNANVSNSVIYNSPLTSFLFKKKKKLKKILTWQMLG